MARLIAASCDVDLTTNDGWTALHEAAANGHLGVVQHLLSANTQVGHLLIHAAACVLPGEALAASVQGAVDLQCAAKMQLSSPVVQPHAGM